MTLRKNADISFENSYDYSSSTKRIILSTSRITFKFMAVKTHEMKNIPNFMLNHILSYNFLTNLPWKSYTTFNVLGSCRANVNKNFSAKVPTANASPSTLSSSLAAMETMTKYHKKLNIRLGRHFSGKRQYKMMFSIKFGITFVFYVLTAIKIKVILIDSTYVSSMYVMLLKVYTFYWNWSLYLNVERKHATFQFCGKVYAITAQAHYLL